MSSDLANTLVYLYMEGCPWCVKFSPVYDEFRQLASSQFPLLRFLKLERSQISPEQMKDYTKKYDIKVSGFPYIAYVNSAGKAVELDTEKYSRSVDDLCLFIKDLALATPSSQLSGGSGKKLTPTRRLLREVKQSGEPNTMSLYSAEGCDCCKKSEQAYKKFVMQYRAVLYKTAGVKLEFKPVRVPIQLGKRVVFYDKYGSAHHMHGRITQQSLHSFVMRMIQDNKTGGSKKKVHSAAKPVKAVRPASPATPAKRIRKRLPQAASPAKPASPAKRIQKRVPQAASPAKPASPAKRIRKRVPQAASPAKPVKAASPARPASLVRLSSLARPASPEKRIRKRVPQAASPAKPASPEKRIRKRVPQAASPAKPVKAVRPATPASPEKRIRKRVPQAASTARHV
jgi:hypothetical protein